MLHIHYLPYFKQPCRVGWSGFLISTLCIRQLESQKEQVIHSRSPRKLDVEAGGVRGKPRPV